MIFKKQIEEQARRAALHILIAQQIGDQALQSSDAITALARGTANYFYLYGTIFSVFKVSLLGTEQEVTYCYGHTFVHTYNDLKDQQLPVIDEARANVDSILTAERADQYIRKNQRKSTQD